MAALNFIYLVPQDEPRLPSWVTERDLTAWPTMLMEGGRMSRQYHRSARYGGHGTSYCYVDCPFCGTATKAFIWSMSGGGKKCDNKECRAMHVSYGNSVASPDGRKTGDTSKAYMQSIYRLIAKGRRDDINKHPQ
jgi:hypothetical protein